jgi:CBS domain-containing protein
MESRNIFMDDKNTIAPWMKKAVVSIGPSASLREAAALLAKKRVGTLPVVDELGHLVGITTMGDILKLFLPDFLSLVKNSDFVKDFGAMRELSKEDIEKADSLTVGEVMEESVSINRDTSLVRAMAIMNDHELTDLPVLQDGELVGVASRVDIGRAILEHYLDRDPE